MRHVASLHDLNDEHEIEYGDVNFHPNSLIIIENELIKQVESRLHEKKWRHFYYTYENKRRFTINFALGLQLEFRVYISTNLNIIIRGTNLLPGGQHSILNKEFIPTLVSILYKFHDKLLSSALVPTRDIIRWNETHKKWKKDTFNYDPDEDHLFQIDKRECEILSYNTHLKMVYQDKITKAIVEVEGTNVDDGLLDQQARGKLYTLRELREI